MNAAAVLALSLHAYGAAIIGGDVKDRDGRVHRGATAANDPIPEAAATLSQIAESAATAATKPTGGLPLYR